MAATNEALQVEVGITLNKLTQQLAQAEARFNKATKKVETDFNKLNNGSLSRTARKFDEIGQEAERATARAAAGANRMQSAFSSSRGQIQNVAFQLGDFATQVGAGTAASVALGQQLPQLLGGFGALGAVLGAVVAVGVPLAAAFLKTGETAATASESVDALEAALKRLQEANAVYSTDGLQAVIDKYGELNAEILLLIERQRQFALESTMLAAKEAAGAFRGELADVLGILAEYNAYTESAKSFPDDLAYAADAANDLQEQFGLTVLEAQALELAVNAAMRTNDAEVMANAIATISGVLQESTLAGTEFAGTLLDAESALRAVNAEAGGIGGWLGSAISGAQAFAANLWNAAAAANAAAQASANASFTGTAYAANTAAASGPAGGPAYVPPPAPTRPQARPLSIDFGYTPAAGGGVGGSSGGSSNPAKPAYWDEPIAKVKEGKQTFADYNQTVEDGANTIADFFGSILDGSKSAQEALADLLMQLAQFQLQKAILGIGNSSDFMGSIFGAVGGSFEGGGYTGTGSRSGGVDGRGGFPAILHPNETVVDHTKGGTSGSPVTFHIDARGAQMGVEEKIRQVLREQTPGIVNQSLSATDRAMRRTRNFGGQR
jgi:hypothetical protein